MALTAFGVPKHGAAVLDEGRCSLWLHHSQRIGTLGAFRTFSTLTLEALTARTVVTVAAFLPRTLLPRTFVTGALLTGTVVTHAIFTRPVIALAVIARTVVATRPVIALTIIPGTVVATRTVIPVAPAVAAAFTLRAAAVAIVAFTALAVVTGTVAVLVAVAALVARLGLAVLALAVVGVGFGGRGGLSPALVLEVDVEAVGELVAAEDLARRTRGLHGPHDPEVMLGMLQVVLGQHAVAARRRVTGELLVLFENVLGVAAHLDAVGAVRIESPVRVLLLRLATATASIAAALTLHTLKISHSS